MTSLPPRQRTNRRISARCRTGADVSNIQIAPVESAPEAIVRDAGSFERATCPRTLEKRKPISPKTPKGPFYAEYVIEAPAAGNYQVDILNQEKGAGTPDLWVNGVWVKRGAGPVQNRAASPDAGGWSYLAIVPLSKGDRIRFAWNTRPGSHTSRSYCWRAHTFAETPLTSVQIAKRYGVNPASLNNSSSISSAQMALHRPPCSMHGKRSGREPPRKRMDVPSLQACSRRDIETPEAIAASTKPSSAGT